jgi:transcriptional regulator with XRE-family HTH domain
MDTHRALGDYLRARRERVRPEDVGLVGGGRRRVPGLRREELATLAGISADYYLRLEQGRDQNPSTQVLNGIARVMQLDADSTAYLHELANQSTRRRSTARPSDRVPVGIGLLLDSLPTPAFVQNKYFDVLAANLLGQALSPNYQPGVNLLRAVFLDPADRDLHQDWDRVTSEAVAGLRAVSGSDINDAQLQALVGELSLRSEQFRKLWARHDVHQRTGGISRMRHPDVGDLQLRHEKLVIAGSGGLLLVVYHAEPGTESEASLRLLGTIAATQVAEPKAQAEATSSLPDRATDQ